VSKLEVQFASTKGYYADSIGGGGDYWHDSADVSSLDNGFTVIVATDGGRWKLLAKNGIVNVKQAGAKGDGVADDTVEIQAAIDYVHGLGGGSVYLPRGTYNVDTTASTEWFYAGNPLSIPSAANTVAGLILRSGVTLVGDGAGVTTIYSTKIKRTPICLVSMDGGGVRNLTVRSYWDASHPEASTSGGHGILILIWSPGDYNKNIVLENLKIHSVGSYGIGAQWGNYENNRYKNLHIYNTGSDSIDHKVRGGVTGSPATSRGVSFTNILAEQFGKRLTIEGAAGLDIRGPATVSNIVVKNFGVAHSLCAGIRFSAGIQYDTVLDRREPSSYSTLTNFEVLASPEFQSRGIVLLSSSSTTVTNGVVKGCVERGVSVDSSTSGFWDTHGSLFSNISVIGSRTGSSFLVNTGVSSYISFVNCNSISERTIFTENSLGITAGQTVFSVDVDPATAIVLKNNVQLTITTDYTITSTTLTLAVGVLSTDIIEVIYPTSKGFTISGSQAKVIGCTAYYNIDPLALSSDQALADTIGLLGNNFGFSGYRAFEDISSPYLQPYGAAADIDFDCRSKGAGSVDLRSNGSRAIRANNLTAGCVNYIVLRGSEAGDPTQISATGSDTNIDLELSSKGSSGVDLTANGARSFRADNLTAGCVNWVGVRGSLTGEHVLVTAAGTDANIDLKLVSKGTGKLSFGAWVGNADTAITGYITIKDSAGNIRKLATID
jgi:hypothetical protein